MDLCVRTAQGAFPKGRAVPCVHCLDTREPADFDRVAALVRFRVHCLDTREPAAVMEGLASYEAPEMLPDLK